MYCLPFCVLFKICNNCSLKIVEDCGSLRFLKIDLEKLKLNTYITRKLTLP